MDIYTLLKKDHEDIKILFSELGKKRDEEALKKIEQEILRHSTAEDKIFYKALIKRAGKLKQIIEVADEEHHHLEGLLKLSHKVNDEEWEILRSVIEKEFLSHVEVEENEIFKLAKEHFSADEAKELAEKMKKKKEEL